MLCAIVAWNTRIHNPLSLEERQRADEVWGAQESSGAQLSATEVSGSAVAGTRALAGRAIPPRLFLCPVASSAIKKHTPRTRLQTNQHTYT